MKLVVDECCDAILVEDLRKDGHDIIYVLETAQGAKDDTILQMAADDKRILLTEDKDFGELVFRLGLPAYGVILLRIDPADTSLKLARLCKVIAKNADRLAGHFVVIDEVKARFRQLRTK